MIEVVYLIADPPVGKEPWAVNAGQEVNDES